ncbi:TPA: G5 domain-containing protein [Streptococcus pneumoniae]|uniref:pneumococcal collagen-like adhesin PclA n=4 Tax=Streptococcus pneumoniae TaxID=1313 RepID=UPI0005E7354F|nr:G5 domain-containing protein [Streptococcus pneumoniae]CKC62078.1 putative collagen-like surface-anchored protein [Streptococcus pneumoniae]COO67548.1 putative collagen-like surface-anchored protein [Streptococcus pneumoniae]COR76310.1 putative collagen-like surface-anchored protein [Streptococcus pneumoniae]COS04052.1 putative collagen-like surface-anchored protein [Streptococcus pneumoniae]HEU3981596.1 G5 domain-containing protein [Streptococcus pneumoniae]
MKHSHKKSFDWYSMQQRYSIRKYYFGAASVLLGTALVLGVAASVQTVQAEENKQETTNSISVGRGEAATKPAEVSASNKEKTYAAPTVANPVETTPVKTEEVTKPAEKVEEAKDKKEEVTHQDAVDKSKLLTALSRAKKLESKLYTEASAANLQTSIQAGQSLLGKADATEAELSAAESSIQSFIIGLELRSNSNKETVSETPVAKKADAVESKEGAKPAATTERSAVDSAILPTSTADKVETTSAPASINEILKLGLSLSDARQNPAIRKEDVNRGYSGFRAASNPANPIVSGSGNTVAFADISQGGRSYSFRGYGNSRGGNSIHYDVTTVRSGNSVNFTISYSAPGDSREFVNNNFILDKGDGFGNPSNATITSSNPRVREQSKSISQGANYVSHSGYSMTSAISTNTEQTIRFSLPIINLNGDLSVRLKPVTFNVDQGGGGAATSNDPYSNSNYYYRANPLYLDANPYGGTNNKTVSEDIDFQTVYLPTSKLPEGQTRLVREGEKGQRQITYKVHRFGNETVLGLPISNRVTKEAKPRIMQIGVAKELIDTVKPRVDQNKVGDTNNLTFYLDNDGNGVYTEGVDELVQKIAIKDGAKGEKGDQGERGLTGAQGAKGEKGARGERGLTGAQGAKGEKGDRGERGLTGAQGAKGEKGDRGERGLTGAQGAKGEKGDQGERGLTGAQGAKGEKGAQGERGLTGAQGAKGEKGDQGERGITGAKGEKGAQGERGLTGAKGEKGDQGERGLTGAQGEKGARGERGLTGAKGEKGAQGQAGRDGVTPTVTVKDNKNDGTHTITINDGRGNVTSTVVRDGFDGASPLVATQRNDADKTTTVIFYYDKNGNNELDASDKKLKEVVIADGAKGEKGDKGEQGLQGRDGEQGPKGEDGKTPTVKVTDGQDGTHTITINDGKGGITTTVVRDGFDGASPLVSTHRNEADKTTTVIFYYDLNDNNQFDEGDTKLKEVVIADGKQGPKGDKGDNGKDGFTPEVTVTDNNNGTHTITITQPDNRPSLTTIVKNGEDGKTPKVKAERDDAKKQTTLTFYIDKDGDGSYTAGKDELVQTTVVKDGQDGAAGASGRDGKEVLNGKVDPTTEGKYGDTFVNTQTGDVFVKKGNTWEPAGNIKGPKGDKGADGAKGEKGDQGERGLTGSKGEKGDQGERGLTGAQGAKGDKGEQGLQGRDGAQGPKGADGQRGPAGPQGPKGEQGNPGTPGKDGKSLIAVKNGTETKVYVEDPARPGQPLNPNQPLATITDGRNGTNGQSPTITATRSVQNGKNGVLVTITPVGGRPQTTFVEDGQKGADGKTPTVTITEGQNGTHTLTVHNPGSPDVTTTIRDGATGQAGRDGKDVLNGKVNPQPNQGKNGDKYINTETGDVYVKNNGNWDKEGNIKGPKGDKGADGAKGEKGDQGERGLTGAQGAKGADGAVGRDGRDGKDVLNGKANPEAHQGKDGDKYVNTETGDVFVKNNGNWDKEGNIKGPKGDKGADGAKGEKGDRGERGLTGAQGAKGADGAAGRDGRDGRDGKDVLNGKVNPEANQGKDGDKYVNTETGDVFVKNNGNWDKEGNIKGPKGDKGERGEDGKTPEVTVTPGKDGHSTDITFTVPGKDPVTVNVKDGENGLNGKTPKVDLLRVQGKNGNPSHTIVTFYTDENNDGKYTPGTDELLGSEMIKDGAKGADGRDGKSLLTVKDGKETKVYQEDPANPGQPLNPEKPLAVIRDGVDGKSPTVTAVRKDEAGHKGVEITVDNHDGSQPTTVFVQDGAKGETGATGQDGQTPTSTTQRGQDGQSTVVTITTSGKDPVTFTVKDGKNGKDGRAPKIKVEDITSPSRIRRATDAAATPTRNGIRVTVYDDVNDNGVYDEGVDKVLNSKDIYNGIDGRDGSAPTITTKDNGDGTHTITVQNPDGSESTTVVKDGKDGKAATATTTENPDGSHTVTITNPDGTKNEFVVKNGRDGVDGRTPTASVRDNGDGSHTIVITNPEGVTTETTVRDGKSPKVTITDEQNGTHKISVLNGDGTTTETIITDGKSPVATVRDNQDGTYTIRVENGNGTVSETTVRDGKSPTAKVVDNGDGTHTITVVNSDGTTTTTTVRDGREPKLEVIDNNDGSHTIKVTGADGKGTTTTIFDGKSPKANIVDNGDGTHTLTIVDSDGREYKSIIKDGKDGKDSVSPTVTVKNNNDGTHVVTITNPDGSKTEMVIKDGKDGKSPKVSVEDNGDGSHTITIINSDGTVTKTVIKDGKDGRDGRDGRDGKDGKDGKCGCQDKPVTPSNDKPVPPTPNVPTPEVPVKPVPAVPEQPVVPTPAQPATPVNANPVAPTTGKENRGDKLPETGSQSDYISVLLGSGILLSLYVGRRKED